MLGDLGYLDDLNEEVEAPGALYIFYIAATLVLYITLLNLLIALISETFGKVKGSEKLTKNWERWNIIMEIDITSENSQEKDKKPEYLMYLFNEKHSKEDNSEFGEIKTKLHGIVKKIKKILKNVKKQNMVNSSLR